jgi:hypothetical protein
VSGTYFGAALCLSTSARGFGAGHYKTYDEACRDYCPVAWCTRTTIFSALQNSTMRVSELHCARIGDRLVLRSKPTSSPARCARGASSDSLQQILPAMLPALRGRKDIRRGDPLTTTHESAPTSGKSKGPTKRRDRQDHGLMPGRALDRPMGDCHRGFNGCERLSAWSSVNQPSR